MSSEENPTDTTSSSTQHVRDTVTSDYVNGVKERTALKEQIVEITKELNNVKGKNYDLLKKIEKLENEVSLGF